MREQIANHTIQRASRQYTPPPQDEADEDDDYTTSMPRSAIRYPLGRPYTYQQGNRRIVVHPEPPPKQRRHWLVYVGVGMIAMLALWVGFQMLGYWWTEHQLDAAYGFPRTYQVDAVVGHDDSAAHPTHFIFLNLKGRVVIVELPGGNVAHARIYNGPAIIGGNPAQTPVTAEFQDVNGDGKMDMIVDIGTQQFTYINDGTQFTPQQ
jgi:hypothetical protein